MASLAAKNGLDVFFELFAGVGEKNS